MILKINNNETAVTSEFNYDEFEKLQRKLNKLVLERKNEKAINYIKSNNPNKRAVAASFGFGLDELKNDNNIDVRRIVAQNAIKYNKDVVYELINDEDTTVKTSAIVALGKAGLLKEKDIENLETPIIRVLINSRIALDVIAKVYKFGEIKLLLNKELNTMSRRDHIDVEPIRNILNAQPFINGDYFYKVEMEFDDELENEISDIDIYNKKLKEEESKKFDEESDEFFDEASENKSLDDILSGI